MSQLCVNRALGKQQDRWISGLRLENRGTALMDAFCDLGGLSHSLVKYLSLFKFPTRLTASFNVGIILYSCCSKRLPE